VADPFVGEIRIFGFNFPPRGWAFCDGQLLPISQNTALFSLLGTFYGGDGKSTFALPNLQGSAPLHHGQGPGLSDYVVGQAGGSDDVTLSEAELPQHTHSLSASGDPADLGAPSPTRSLARSQPAIYKQPANASPQPLALQAVGVTGGSVPHNNMMPFLTLNFSIALQGVFPPRASPPPASAPRRAPTRRFRRR
jgi:microcystin-dependent protein